MWPQAEAGGVTGHAGVVLGANLWGEAGGAAVSQLPTVFASLQYTTWEATAGRVKIMRS